MPHNLVVVSDALKATKSEILKCPIVTRRSDAIFSASSNMTIDRPREHEADILGHLAISQWHLPSLYRQPRQRDGRAKALDPLTKRSCSRIRAIYNCSVRNGTTFQIVGM